MNEDPKDIAAKDMLAKQVVAVNQVASLINQVIENKSYIGDVDKKYLDMVERRVQAIVAQAHQAYEEQRQIGETSELAFASVMEMIADGVEVTMCKMLKKHWDGEKAESKEDTK